MVPADFAAVWHVDHVVSKWLQFGPAPELDLSLQKIVSLKILVHTRNCQKCLIFCVRVSFRCKKYFPRILISQLCLLRSCTPVICWLTYQVTSLHRVFGKIEVGMPGIEPGTSHFQIKCSNSRLFLVWQYWLTTNISTTSHHSTCYSPRQPRV